MSKKLSWLELHGPAYGAVKQDESAGDDEWALPAYDAAKQDGCAHDDDEKDMPMLTRTTTDIHSQVKRIEAVSEARQDMGLRYSMAEKRRQGIVSEACCLYTENIINRLY